MLDHPPATIRYPRCPLWSLCPKQPLKRLNGHWTTINARPIHGTQTHRDHRGHRVGRVPQVPLPTGGRCQRRIGKRAGAPTEAQHRLRLDGQPRLLRGRHLRRHSSRCGDAAHQQAGRRGHAPAQLQCRDPVHAEPFGHHDRTLRDSQRHALRALPGPTRRINPLGSHHPNRPRGAELAAKQGSRFQAI